MVSAGFDPLHGKAVEHPNTMLLQFGPHDATQRRIEGGENGGQEFDHGNGKPPTGHGVGHFHADITRADDDDGGRTVRHEVFLKGETVRHPPEKKDPRKIDTGEIRYQRNASRADHQFIVGKSPTMAFPVIGQNEFLIR